MLVHIVFPTNNVGSSKNCKVVPYMKKRRPESLAYPSYPGRANICYISLPKLGVLKKSPAACLLAPHKINVIFEFQNVTHACAFCFCLGVSRPFASDKSQKRIDRELEGLGKHSTGTRQSKANFSPGKHLACTAGSTRLRQENQTMPERCFQL